MEKNELRFAADQGGDLASFSGIAYSGGKISQSWSSVPLVIDLAGMKIAKQVPLMYNHWNDPRYRLGVVTPKVEAGQLAISGGIDREAPFAAQVIEAGKKIPWQNSVGVSAYEYKHINAGEKVTVNDREQEGPFALVTKSELREVSVVAIGADAETELRIAAGWNMDQNVNKEEHMEVDVKSKQPDPVPAEPKKDNTKSEAEIRAAAVEEERERVAKIRAALNEYPNLIDKAITAGWSEEQARDMVETVKAATAGLQTAGPNITVKTPETASASVLEAALSLRAGCSEQDIVAGYGEEVAEKADKLRGISLAETVVAACRLHGIEASIHLDHETIRAAFSTTDLPVLLGNVANKRMLREFNSYPLIAPQLCSAGDLADYKESDRVRLFDVGDLEEVPAGGEVPNSTLGEETAKNQAKRYGKTFWLDEMMIINDDMNAFTRIPRIFGSRAARKIDKVFFERLMANPTQADGKALFHTAHKNLKTGSGSALSLPSLKAARVLFTQQVDADGESIAVLPKFLLVPSWLEPDAQELVAAQAIVTGENATKPATSIVSKWGLQVIGAPQLDNAANANYSTTAWYLFADPAQADTFEIGYLRGQRTPVVQMIGFDSTRFGIGYRVAFSFGIREQDFRGMVKSTGAN